MESGGAFLGALQAGQDPFVAMAQSLGPSIDIGQMIRNVSGLPGGQGRGIGWSQAGALGVQFLASRIRPHSYAQEGAAIGGTIGSAFGPVGAALGTVAGTILGGIFGRPSGRAAQEREERKQFQRRLLDLIGRLEKDLRPIPDYFRSLSRQQIFGSASAYYSGRNYAGIGVQALSGGV